MYFASYYPQLVSLSTVFVKWVLHSPLLWIPFWAVCVSMQLIITFKKYINNSYLPSGLKERRLWTCMCPLSTCNIMHDSLPSHFMNLKDLQFYYAEELEQRVSFCYFYVNGDFSLDSHNLRKILPVEERKHLSIRVNCIPRSGNDFKLFCS